MNKITKKLISLVSVAALTATSVISAIPAFASGEFETLVYYANYGTREEVAEGLADMLGEDNYYTLRYNELTDTQQNSIIEMISYLSADERTVSINGANYTTTDEYKIYSQVLPAIEAAYQQGRTGIIADVKYEFKGGNIYKKYNNMLSWQTKYKNGTISSYDNHPYWVNEYGDIMGIKVFYDLSLVTKDTEFIKSVTVTPWVEPNEMKNGYIIAAG